MSIDALKEEIKALQHAMQTGVAFKMDVQNVVDRPAQGECSLKHLRVGVNAAMVESAALARLLVSKGIITELEYLTALRDGMKTEMESYQEWLTTYTGKKVVLG